MISPESGGEIKFIQRNSVILPDPLGPIMQTTSPFATFKLTSFRTCNSPKLFDTDFISSK